MMQLPLLQCSPLLHHSLLHRSPLLRSSLLLFSLPFFLLLQALGLGYPVPIGHPNFIKDWLDIWHKSVRLTSDQHWFEFGDHCSCIWFGEETCDKLNNNKTDVECRETLGHLGTINPNMIKHFAKQSPLLFWVTYTLCTQSNQHFLLIAYPMSRLMEWSKSDVSLLFVDICGSVPFTILPIVIENPYR